MRALYLIATIFLFGLISTSPVPKKYLLELKDEHEVEAYKRRRNNWRGLDYTDYTDYNRGKGRPIANDYADYNDYKGKGKKN